MEGWDASSDRFCNLIEAGIVDPVRVTRTALRSAGSVAGLLLTTDALVADDVAAAAEIRKSLMQVMPGGQPMPLSY
jgi:chaperonin GroEL